MSKKNTIEHLKTRTSLSQTGCWEWNGSKNADGYSTTCWHGKTRLAYHIFYEEMIGSRDPLLRLDHMCRNRACVNPSHLQQITHKENCQLGDHRTNNKELRKTHCLKGHPLTGQNLYIDPKYKSRHCKECRRVTSRVRHNGNPVVNAQQRQRYHLNKLKPDWLQKERARNRIRMRIKRSHKLT